VKGKKIMHRKLLLILITALLLLGFSAEGLMAGSLITGRLYQSTNADGVVAMAIGDGALANVGGILVDGSLVRGDIQSSTDASGVIAIALGDGSSARAGGVTLRNAIINGNLDDHTSSARLTKTSSMPLGSSRHVVSLLFAGCCEFLIHNLITKVVQALVVSGDSMAHAYSGDVNGRFRRDVNKVGACDAGTCNDA
jgi:hypothetical protein